MDTRRTTRVLTVAIITTALAACSTSSPDDVVYHPSYATYSTPASLRDDASLIIVGTVLSSEVRVIDVAAEPAVEGDPDLDPNAGAEGETLPAEFPYTVYQVSIKQVISGNAQAGETIEVGVLGGTIDGVVHVDPEAPSLQKQATYALYLQEFPGEVPAQLMNNKQAAYKKTPAGFASVSPDNPIASKVASTLVTATN
jgi:hypothetical protein